jgi:Protein of unknown function (DUF3800)
MNLTLGEQGWTLRSIAFAANTRLRDNRNEWLVSAPASFHLIAMLVFIDESGDPGFKLASGSSPVFVMAMVIFDNSEAAQQTSAVVEALRASLGLKDEFKFNRSRDEVRDAFFAAIASCPFRVRAIVVEKERIRSIILREHKTAFYNFFLKTMVRFDNGRLANARIVIDGSGDRLFRRGLAKHVSRNASKGAIKDIRFKDSANDPLVQLADMCAGAIARSYRDDRAEPKRWRKMLAKRIDDVWDFK